MLKQLKLSESTVSRALNDPPTAVCCISDHVTGAMRAYATAVWCPAVKCLSSDMTDLRSATVFEAPLSTMTQPRQSAGQQLVEIVSNLVENGDRPEDHQKLYRATLVRRGTDNPSRAGLVETPVGSRQNKTQHLEERKMKKFHLAAASAIVTMMIAGVAHADTIRFLTTENQPERLAKQEAMAADFNKRTGHKVVNTS